MHQHGFGALVDWGKEAAHRGDTFGFPRARLVLEGQAHLLDVLCSITDKILVDIDPLQPPRTEKWQNLVSHEAFRETGIVEFWSPYLNPAFSRPPTFDINRLITLAKTRLDEAGDHLWYLQTDTAYLRRYLKIVSASEAYKKATAFQKAKLLVEQMRVAIDGYHWWRWVEMECRHVKAMRQRYRDNIRPGQRLPTSYQKALGALQLLLGNQVVRRVAVLKAGMPFVPGLEKYWRIVLEFDANTSDNIGWIQRQSSQITQENLSEDPLDWILYQLLGRVDNPRVFDPAMLFAMLEDHLSSNPPEKKRLDENMYRALSDLATCHEMFLAVKLHRPLIVPRHLFDIEATEDMEPWNLPLSGGCKCDPNASYQAGASLLKNFFNQKTPSGPKNVEWLSRSRVLRTARETFWKQMREIVSNEVKSKTSNQEQINGSIEPISAILSHEYLQEEQLADAEILAAIQGVHIQPPTTSFFHEVEPRPASFRTVARQEKVKKRGREIHHAATGPRIDEPNIHEEPTEPSEATTILVSQQSLGVFHLMFPNKDDPFKEILWDRFVHAMCDAGFVARNISGSVVAFTQVSGQAGRIVFHRPHPVDKIDSVLLRIMAKRMAKWFGWRREIFVLRTQGI